MSVKLTATAPTMAKSVMTAVVNARMVGSYMTESASQVGFAHYRVLNFYRNCKLTYGLELHDGRCECAAG